jgi:hypothetical protein
VLLENVLKCVDYEVEVGEVFLNLGVDVAFKDPYSEHLVYGIEDEIRCRPLYLLQKPLHLLQIIHKKVAKPPNILILFFLNLFHPIHTKLHHRQLHHPGGGFELPHFRQVLLGGEDVIRTAVFVLGI